MSEKNLILFPGGIFRDLVATTPKFPKAGETIMGQDFFMGFGGKSANQSVMCALLGGKAAIIGRLGDDDHGKAYLQNFKSVGVRTDHLKIEPSSCSGIASIFVNTESGENQIIIVPGANDKMSPADIEQAEPLFQSASIVVCALEMSMDAIVAALKSGRSHGAKTILNAAPAKSDLDPEILNNTDILCVNETEAEILTGLPVESLDEIRVSCQKLLEKCPVAIVTCGSRGAVFATRDQPNPVLVETEKVEKVVDTTGAGDAFTGALAFFLENFKHLTLEECIRRSCKIASTSVQRPGTQASYPKAGELDSLMK